MNGVNNWLLVFLGGGFGALFRYLLSLVIKNSSSGFPYATFWVNISGCLLIGIFYMFLTLENQNLKLLLIVGLLGGFTTFSSFGYETFQLFNEGKHETAFFYIILSNICGLAAVYLGAKIALAMV